jgi:hypothetical protein
MLKREQFGTMTRWIALRIVASSATRYAAIKEVATIGEGGHTNRALCVAYIFIGVA